MQRAEAARSALLTSHAGAHVDLLQLDVGSVESVLNAAKVVKSRWEMFDAACWRHHTGDCSLCDMNYK